MLAVKNTPSSRFLQTPQHPPEPSLGTGQFRLSTSTQHTMQELESLSDQPPTTITAKLNIHWYHKI